MPGQQRPPHSALPILRYRRTTCLFALLAVCSLALSQASYAAPGDIFRWRDDKGQANYGDRPIPGAQRLYIIPPPANTASSTRVTRVYDGDTIQLEGGEKVRLLGINTPETGGRGKSAEAGAAEAKAWLLQKLSGLRVRLETDVTQRDKYHRLLAHVFLPDGTHINLLLVRLGLATTDIFPPNLKYVDALLTAEQEAERAKRGLWALPAYAPKPAESLRSLAPFGWQRLTGKVVAADSGRNYARLKLHELLEVRVPNEDLHLFRPIQSYLGHTLEVRGWASRRGSNYAVTVRHPSALLNSTARTEFRTR